MVAGVGTLETSPQTRLLRGEQGAVMLMGIYFCVLLMALVFYVLGVAQTVLAQEGMQDAADAASFASAIVHARGMNLLVYINWVMAALVAVLIAIRLVESLFIIAGTTLSTLSFFSFGAATPLASLCWTQVNVWNQLYERTKKVVFPVLEALHSAEKAVSVVVPAAATLEALVESGKTHAPADAVFALPGRLTLPVEFDSFPPLCERGADLVGYVATLPIRALGGPMEGIADGLEDGLGAMAGSLSGYLCGASAGSGDPPVHRRTVEKLYPEATVQRPCSSNEECAAQERAGAALYGQMTRGQPRADGRCPRATLDEPCPESDPYERYAAQVREICAPHGDFRPKSYSFVLQNVRSTYELKPSGKYEVRREVLSSRYERDQPLPCRDTSKIQKNRWSNYERKGFVSGARYALPVCASNEVGIGGRVGAGPVTISQTIAAHVFACKVDEVVETPLAKRGEKMEGQSDKHSPMKMEDDVELGGEDFQIRALAYGDGVGPGEYSKGVHMALFGREPEASVASGAAEVMSFIHRFSVARAEYYFDHDGHTDRKDWLWEPRWTARLRRFRLPNQDQETTGSSEFAGPTRLDSQAEDYGGLSPRTLEDSCAEAGVEFCEQASSVLNKMNEGVLH
jgi:hypothetical protein